MTDDPIPPDRSAGWITSPQWRADPNGPLPLLGTTFHCGPGARQATLTIAGLGVYQPTINAAPISPGLLEPGYTDYARHAEFLTHDVTHCLREGCNAMTIALGPGMYRSQNPDGRWTKVFTDYGELATCAVLRWTDSAGEHHIVTDRSWRSTLGPVTSSNWVGGEDFDAARMVGLDAAGIDGWPEQPAVDAVVPTELSLRHKTIPPLQVVEELSAIAVTEPAVGTVVVDFGVNFAGWPRLDLPAASAVRLRPAELLHPDGTINEITEGWGPVFHTVRTADRNLRWTPQFMYNGLRYLEITGLDGAAVPDTIGKTALGLVIAADTPAAGRFGSSNQRIDNIHRIIRRAITSNMYSTFTDCPQREKLCYLEQLHLLFPVLRWNYHSEALLENTVRLVRDAQQDDGHIGLYVPEWDPFPDPWRGDANWGLAIVFLPWQLYTGYGNTRVLADSVDAAIRYVEYLIGSLDGGVLSYGLGDWDGSHFRSVPLVATSALARAIGVLADIVDVLGRADGSRWRERRSALVADLRARFVRPDNVGDGSVADLAVALSSELLVGDEIADGIDRLDRMVIDSGCYPDVGEVAMAALVQVLARYDRHQTLFAMTQVDEKPSYGYMLRHGATALTETWDGPTFGISQNHFMNGAIDDWFFGHLAGLGQQDGDVGFRRLSVRPRPCGDLTAAGASYLTPSGEFGSEWTITDGQFVLDVQIPADAVATIDLPNGQRHQVPAGHHRFQIPAVEIGALEIRAVEVPAVKVPPPV